jgi:excisionase family DNA binding protein
MPSGLRDVQFDCYNCGNMHDVLCPPKTHGRRLLTTGGAARLADCDSATIRRAIVRGELEALRLGKRGDYRIPADALNEWLRPTHKPAVNP